MKKAISLAVGAAAMVVLSGCNMVNNGDGGGGNGEEVSKVDILDLYKGYVVEGRDQNDKSIEFDFCHDRYVLYHDGADFYGTFKITDSDYRVSMFQGDPKTASYRIDTMDGQILENHKYDVKFNGYDILVDSITRECNL